MPKPAKPHDIANLAIRSGVGIGRFRIDKAQAAEIRRAEMSGGHDAGLTKLLEILRTK